MLKGACRVHILFSQLYLWKDGRRQAGRKDGQMNRLMAGWLDKWLVGQICGLIGVWMGGQTDGYVFVANETACK